MSVSDEDYWTEKVTELQRGQLDTVRKSATAWSALFSSLLGVFGLVAFSGGLKEIDELAPDLTWVIKLVTTLAALGLAIATFFAAKAAGSLLITATNDTTWEALRNTTINQANSAKNDLIVAKISGLVAIVFVLAGSGVAIWGPSAETPAPTVVVDTPEGVVCGDLSRSDNGGVTVDGKELESVASLSVVSKC
jgi:hypothetical protein